MTVELLETPTTAAAGTSVAAITAHRLSAAIDSRLLTEWQSLFEADGACTAWQHPRLVEAECAHQPAWRDEPFFLGEHHDSVLHSGAVLLPKLIRSNQAGGLGPGWNLQGYRLVGGRFMQRQEDAGSADRLLAAVFDTVQTRGADFLLLEDLDEQSELWRQIHERRPNGWSLFAPDGCQARLRIRFPEQRAEYWDQFSKKTLSTFRRKLKKFGETRLDRVTRPEEMASFLAAAHEISLQTWQSRRLGTRVRNSEAELASLSALAEAGLARCYLWYANDEPAAFCIGNQAHGIFNYEEVGYATKFARFSPGQMLVVQMIEDLLAHDTPQWFDFGGGDAEYKRMFANHTSSSGTVWLTPPSWRARASLGWIQLCRGLKQTARRTAARLGLATRVRQWIRYGGVSPQTVAPETTEHGTEESTP